MKNFKAEYQSKNTNKMSEAESTRIIKKMLFDKITEHRKKKLEYELKTKEEQEKEKLNRDKKKPNEKFQIIIL